MNLHYSWWSGLMTPDNSDALLFLIFGVVGERGSCMRSPLKPVFTF